ncbi:MAG TPA: hypothetical protein VM364_12675 [Vicinamibacterales bacterium]|nr:hypothetical protein [Vicinamibacterales bacterium]
MPTISLEQARAAKKRALERFRTLACVTGVGITRIGGEYGVKVNLSEPVEPGVSLPSDIDGVPVRVEVTGEIKAR